jgi:hypothetical protein
MTAQPLATTARGARSRGSGSVRRVTSLAAAEARCCGAAPLLW